MTAEFYKLLEKSSNGTITEEEKLRFKEIMGRHKSVQSPQTEEQRQAAIAELIAPKETNRKRNICNYCNQVIEHKREVHIQTEHHDKYDVKTFSIKDHFHSSKPKRPKYMS